MTCADCHRSKVEVRTIRVGTRETVEVCVNDADCRTAMAARKAAKEAR